LANINLRIHHTNVLYSFILNFFYVISFLL